MSRELRDEIRMAHAAAERLRLARDRLYGREAALAAEVERLREENAELVEALHQLKSEITAEALRMAIEAIGSA